MRIADVLHHHERVIHKIRTTDTVEKAVRNLAEHNIGALLVTDRWGRHVGIFSERDLVRGLEQFGETAPDLPVGEVMTADIVTCQIKDRVHKAMELMTTHRIRHLPVMDNGVIVGMVSIGDLVRALIGEKELEVEVLRDLARSH
jgi:CBS domain-containing protein